METIKIDILNPKARKLLNDLADLDLIHIRETSNKEFTKIIQKLRSKSDNKLNEDEIAREVEAVRSAKLNQ